MSDPGPEKYAPKQRSAFPARNAAEPPPLPTVVENGRGSRSVIADRIEQEMRDAGLTTSPAADAIMDRLALAIARTPLASTAQQIFDLRFHDLMALCTEAIAKNAEQLKVEPYALAVGISGWAIELLAKAEKQQQQQA